MVMINRRSFLSGLLGALLATQAFAGNMLLLGSGSAGPSVPPFTPAQLTGLVGWWDASVFGSMTILSGQVDGINDQSGNGWGLGAWNSGTRPAYSATGQNNLPAMMYDNRAEIQRYQVFPMGTSELTIFVVATLTSSSADFARLISYNSLGQAQDYNNDLSWTFIRNASTNSITFARNAFSLGPITVSYDVPLRLIVTYTSAGVGTFYINGISVATSSGGPTSAFGAAGSLFIGAGLNSQSNRWAGPVSEAGVANVAANGATVTSLDTYLKNKWAL